MLSRMRAVTHAIHFWMAVPRGGGVRERYARYADIARYSGMSLSTARRNVLLAEKMGLVVRRETRYKSSYALNWYLTEKGHDFRLGWLEL